MVHCLIFPSASRCFSASSCFHWYLFLSTLAIPTIHAAVRLENKAAVNEKGGHKYYFHIIIYYFKTLDILNYYENSIGEFFDLISQLVNTLLNYNFCYTIDSRYSNIQNSNISTIFAIRDNP